MSDKHWTDVLLTILKVIGGILLLILTFGLYNGLMRNEEVKEIDEDIKDNDTDLDNINSELKEVIDTENDIKNDIHTTNEQIERMKDKIRENKNKEIDTDVTDDKVKDSLKNIRDFIND